MDLVLSPVKPYGSARSIVRRIGSRLPLAPCPRVRFQLQPFINGARALSSSRGRNELIASLADVASIDREDDASTSLRPGSRPGFIFCSHQRQPRRRSSRRRRLPATLHVEEMESESESADTLPGSSEAIQKISTLEKELAKLREQIAQIVLVQEQSVQAAGPAPHGPGLVPPPPPPPPSLQQSSSAIDLIRERRGKKAATGPQPEPQAPPEMPSMLEVLKDMGKMKLHAVMSCPEGDCAKPSDPMDAATLIADTLKRKFAHRYDSESLGSGDMQPAKPNPSARPPCSDSIC